MIPRLDLKFGLKAPKTVKEARRIDKENGNVIKKELNSMIVSFQLLEENNLLPVGSKRIPCALC